MRLAVLASSLILALASSLAAQSPSADSLAASDTTAADADTGPARAIDPRFLGGGSLFYVQPTAEFGRHVRGGAGFSLAGSMGDSLGILSFRAEFQHVVYGWASVDDSTARNTIMTLDVGPQLVLPAGPVRPYGTFTVGAAYTGTLGSVPCREHCTYDDDGDPEKIGYAFLPRLTYTTARAVGVLFRTARATARRPAVWLDVRLSQRHNGETRYAVGGAREQFRSATDYRTWHMGFVSGSR